MDNNLKQTLIKFKKANDERYAKPDGYYPTMTVGLADNLTPYSEDSGAYQENPFISNGTGTNNNTEIVTVGDYGLFKSKNGNTLVANQLAKEINSTNWNSTNSTAVFSDGIATFTATAQNGSVSSLVDLIQNHKYLVLATIKNTTASENTYLRLAGTNLKHTNTSTSYQTLFAIYERTGANTNTGLVIRDERASDWDAIQVKTAMCIDLTQMFNGNIPQDLLDHPEHFSWYYNGSLAYNTGTLVNANGIKLVSTGRNLFNQALLSSVSGITKVGDTYSANSSTWNTIPFENYASIKNKQYFIRAKIYVQSGSSVRFRINYTDGTYTDGNSIANGETGVSSVYSTAGKEISRIYIRYGTSGTFVLSEICISLYYTPEQGGEGYDKYYPY